jgi:hypothetical protein
MHMPVLQDVLAIAPVSPAAWAGVMVLGASVLIVGEAYKAWLRHSGAEPAQGAPAGAT